MQLDVFQALADPTRRRIVDLLLSGEQQVGDVVEKAGIHQSGVSRHLRILHESGFVRVRPDGQRRFYALRPEPFRQLEHWLGPYKQLWEERLDRFGAALERGSRKASLAEQATQREPRMEVAAPRPNDPRSTGAGRAEGRSTRVRSARRTKRAKAQTGPRRSHRP